MNTVKYGDRGADVEILQLALKRSGFYSGKIDRIFGENTKRSLIEFQRKNLLRQDGVAGARTWDKLVPYLKGYTTYTVKAGDTLWSISQSFGTSLRAVIAANPTSPPENLKIGSVIYVPFNFSLVPENVSMTSYLNAFICQGLSVRYPFMKSGSIGKSVMQKNIIVLKIGDGDREVFYNASHHANEWLTSTVLLKFVEDYAEAYSVGGEVGDVLAAKLFREYSLYLVTMVNPDGVDLVTGVLNSGKYYENALKISENYPAVPFVNGWKANINGIDLNLQYPAGWESAKEIKYSQGFVSPAPRDFVGEAPLSAPESRAVYDFTLRHKFLLTLSYHSQGEIIYWKYLDFEPENSKKIAEYFGTVSGYAVEETPYASGFAGYKDWFIQDFDRPGYTIEIGLGQSPLPLSQFPKIYSDNLGILTGGMTQVGQIN